MTGWKTEAPRNGPQSEVIQRTAPKLSLLACSWHVPSLLIELTKTLCIFLLPNFILRALGAAFLIFFVLANILLFNILITTANTLI